MTTITKRLNTNEYTPFTYHLQEHRLFDHLSARLVFVQLLFGITIQLVIALGNIARAVHNAFIHLSIVRNGSAIRTGATFLLSLYLPSQMSSLMRLPFIVLWLSQPPSVVRISLSCV